MRHDGRFSHTLMQYMAVHSGVMPLQQLAWPELIPLACVAGFAEEWAHDRRPMGGACASP